MAGLALLSVLLVVGLHLAMRQPLPLAYDLRPAAQEISKLQQQGIPLAHERKHAGEYRFIGRLHTPLPVVSKVRLKK